MSLRNPILPALIVLFAPCVTHAGVDWVTVGDPRNPCDPHLRSCRGTVVRAYRISKTEVTNAQYVEFLNAVAATDPNELYSSDMGEDGGGIARSGSAAGFTYDAIEGRERKPVNFVSFWDALRFANWLHNGQSKGAQDEATTEDGAYTLTPAGLANGKVLRNAGASVFLPSENEWYKAAYYDPVSESYFDYPAGSDEVTSCVAPGDSPNTGNCWNVVGDFTDVGSYTGSASPYGTFDQGGNVFEWNEAFSGPSARSLRGGGFHRSPIEFLASNRFHYFEPGRERKGVGFRVASRVPSAPAISREPPSMASLDSLMDWVTVGDPGNPCGRWYGACRGVVAQVYQILTTEVTNAQYAEFLNAVAATDTNALYNTDMAGAADGAAPKDRPGSSARRAIEGRQHKLPPPLPSITRSGSPGSFEYQAAPGRERRPVNFVSFWDALRFANWLHNGKPVGGQDDSTTEDGAYTLTPTGMASNGVERNEDVAKFFVPSFDEWFKAAYYATESRTWFGYPTGSDEVPTCAEPGATPNTANCEAVVADLTDTASYTGSASPNGTYDQGGNVFEWTEAVIHRSHRIMKGGSWHRSARALRASGKHRYNRPDHESRSVGFRVASRAPSADGS